MVRNRQRKKTKAKSQQPTYGRPIKKANTKIGRIRAPRISNSHVEAVCSNIDPFCPAANGAKQFGGGSSNRTIPVRCVSIGNITTNSSGLAVTRIQPSLLVQNQAAATFSGNEVATWGPYLTANPYAALSAYDGQYRIVSFGVHVYGMSAVAVSEGVVSLITTSGADDTLNVYSTLHLDHDRSTLAGADLYWIAKPVDLTQDFVAIDSAAVNSWTNLYIVVSYAHPSTTVIGFEIIMNIEWYPTLPGILSNVATPGWPRKPKVEENVDKTRNVMSYVYNHLPNKDVVKSIMNVGTAAVSYYNPALGATLSMGSGAVRAIMDVD